MFSNNGALRCQRLIRSIFSAALVAAVWIQPVIAAESARPSTWATAVAGVDGLSNLFQVSPELYRSRQPTAQALKNMLAGQPFATGTDPIRTIVELRAWHDVDGDVLGKSSAVRHEWLKFNPFHPVDDDVIKFLRIVTDKASQPVLVHCAQGSDRTGMMVAIYRIVVQGWSKEDAVREMKEGGYGFHSIWGDLVAYVRNLDVDALKNRVAQAGAWPAATGAIAQSAPAPAQVVGTTAAN
jgi:protein tyrosine/serine phosphatase